MSIYDYQQAFGAVEKTGSSMRKAIDRWFTMYYDGSVSDSADTCQRIPYTVVNKLVKSVFGEYKATGDTPFGQMLLRGLDHQKNLAMQYALIGGACYIKPCLVGGGFVFLPVPRNRVLIFGRDGNGRPTDIGLVETSAEGSHYYTLLERRTVDPQGYLTITNRLYRSQDSRHIGTEIPLKNVPAYAHLADRYRFRKPVGGIGLTEMKLPILNCVDGSYDGVSVYAAAEGMIRNIDQNEAQMNGEFSRGESRIIASRDLLDHQLSMADHLFVGLDEDPERVGITIFSPQLREQSYLARKQEYLRNVESILGLKRGMLSDSNIEDRTATEISASAAEYALTVMEFQRMWQNALEETVALCQVLAELYGFPVREPGHISIDWGNGSLYDQEKTWTDYVQMVDKGLIRPEIALAWRFGLTGESEESIRHRLMPQNQ